MFLFGQFQVKKTHSIINRSILNRSETLKLHLMLLKSVSINLCFPFFACLCCRLAAWVVSLPAMGGLVGFFDSSTCSLVSIFRSLGGQILGWV